MIAPKKGTCVLVVAGLASIEKINNGTVGIHHVYAPSKENNDELQQQCHRQNIPG